MFVRVLFMLQLLLITNLHAQSTVLEPPLAPTVTSIDPKVALQKLAEGNERYTKDMLIHPNRTQVRREAVSAKQTPFAVIVGCSDSRVSPEIIFDQGIGDLFIVRVAGNVVGPIELASVEYAAGVLGSSLVLVLGHENCGAVTAVLQGNTANIEPIAVKIEAAIKEYAKPSDNKLEAAIRANVTGVLEQLKKSPMLAKLLAEKKLEVAGGYYHLESGKVEFCCDIDK